jgi:hypothetical protein
MLEAQHPNFSLLAELVEDFEQFRFVQGSTGDFFSYVDVIFCWFYRHRFKQPRSTRIVLFCSRKTEIHRATLRQQKTPLNRDDS